MPREQINYPGAYYEADPKTGASTLVAPADAALHVSWGVHGTLQIGYETDRDTAAAMVKDPGVPTSGESQDAACPCRPRCRGRADVPEVARTGGHDHSRVTSSGWVYCRSHRRPTVPPPNPLLAATYGDHLDEPAKKTRKIA